MKIRSRPQIEFAERPQALAEGCLRHARIVVAPGTIERNRAQRRRQRNAGNDAGDEKLADRGIGGDGVEHHRDRRRNQYPQRAGGGDHAGTEALREALRHHRRQNDRADGDHGRGRRTGHRRKQRAGEHAGERQTAIPMPDHGGREADHAPRDPAMGEEAAGQDEERDRHDLEAFQPGEQLERNRFRTHVG